MIIHVLADGRRIDDISGMVVQINEKTINAYRLLEKVDKHSTNQGGTK